MIDGGPGHRQLVGQGALQVRRIGARIEFRAAGFRAVPGAVVRRSAYIAPGVVLMPCFVNIGAYVGKGTMVDTWATVGSCAQIGKNCHISGGAGIGGVLRAAAGGAGDHREQLLHRRALRSRRGRDRARRLGFVDGRLSRRIDQDHRPRHRRSLHYGEVPPYSVVVPGALPGKPMKNGAPGPALYCAVIVKRVDEKTRAKTSINELLRD